MSSFFKKYAAEHKILLIFLMIGMLLSVLVALPIPFISKVIIDDILTESKYCLVPYLCGAFVLIISIQLAVLRFNAWAASKFFQKYINLLRKKVTDSLLSSHDDPAFASGKVMVVLSSDIPTLSQLEMTVVTTVTTSTLTVIGYAIMLFALNWKLALVSIALFPAYFFWTLHISNRMRVLTQKSQELNEVLLSDAEIITSNMETIISNNYESKMSSRLTDVIHTIGDFSRRVVLYSNFVSSVSTVITSAAAFIPLVVGVYFVAIQEMSIGDLIVFNTYCGMLLSPLSSFVGLLTKTKLAKVHESRISALLKKCEKNQCKSVQALTADKKELGLEFEGYELSGRNGLLLSVPYLQIEPGETILLTGGNGVGKSLFLKTIAGLYASYRGQIFYRDIELKNVSRQSRVQEIKYVSSTQKFILENADQELFRDKVLSEDRIEAIAGSIGILEVIESLPQGRETGCGELCRQLNAGSMQKMRVLRALAMEPSCLLLDEILSNVSSADCKKIITAIVRSFPNIILIVVEHHFEDRDLFDSEYRIEGGRLTKIYGKEGTR